MIFKDLNDKRDAWILKCLQLYYDKNFKNNDDLIENLKEFNTKTKEFEVKTTDLGYDFVKNGKVLSKFKVNIKENFNKKEMLK